MSKTLSVKCLECGARYCKRVDDDVVICKCAQCGTSTNGDMVEVEVCPEIHSVDTLISMAFQYASEYYYLDNHECECCEDKTLVANTGGTWLCRECLTKSKLAELIDDDFRNIDKRREL